MLKKALIGGSLFLALATVYVATPLGSYVRTVAGIGKDAVHDTVPVEFQLKRARELLTELDPQIRHNMEVIARHEIEVRKTETQIAEREAELVKAKGHIQRLTADLSSGQKVFEYAGRPYGAEQVKADLTGRFERYKAGEGMVASQHKLLSARQQQLQAAQENLTAMLSAREQLRLEIENLEARMQTLKVAQTADDLHFDDSKLGRVKELVSDLKARLEVQEKLTNLQGAQGGEIPLDEPADADIVEQVTSYFGTDKPAEAAVVQQK